MPSRRIPLYVHIAYLFVGLLLTFAILSNGYQFLQNREQMVSGAKNTLNWSVCSPFPNWTPSTDPR